MTPEFIEAFEQCQALAERFGMFHPDTMRAVILALELAPDELKNQIGNIAQLKALTPEACGYLEDGSPMFRLDDVAAQFGVSPTEAEETLQRALSEQEALDLPNEGLVLDPAIVHWKQ